MSVFKALRDYSKRVNKDIVFDSDFQRTIASGNAERSILDEENVFIVKNKDFVLFRKSAVKYITATDQGRKPNQTNSGGLFEAIYDWLQYKKYGIEYSDDKERKSIAYAITTKIAKEGSYKFRNVDKRTKVITKAINENIPKLLLDLGVTYKTDVTKNIKESYNDN